jgi:S-layer protein
MGGVGSFSQLKSPAVLEFTRMAGCFARTLTTGVDQGAAFTGGTGDDTFVATPTTLTILDNINGGAGTDVLAITDGSNTAYTLPTSTTTITGIETLTLIHSADATTDNVAADVTGLSDLRSVIIQNTGTAISNGGADGVNLALSANVTAVTVTGGASTQDIDTVTISDAGTNGASTTDKLATLTLTGLTGAAAISSEALRTLNLNAVAGVVVNTDTVDTDARALVVNYAGGTNGGLTDAGATTATVNVTGATAAAGTNTFVAATTLNLNVNAALTAGTFTTNNATTVNVVLAAAVTASTLGASTVTALNISGTANATLTQTAATAGVITNSGSGNLTLLTDIAAGQKYIGGTGVDTVTFAATATTASTLGEGNDVATFSAVAGTNGSVDAGNGIDTVVLTAANAVTLTANANFEDDIANFEKVSIGAYANLNTGAGNTISLANLDDINTVTSAGSIAQTQAEALIISGFANAGTFEQTALLGTNANQSLTGSFLGASDTFTLKATATNGFANAGALTLANVETVNIILDDSDTTAATTMYDLNLDATSAVSISVSGDAGITFANSSYTVLRTLDASGVTATGTAGVVTFTANAFNSTIIGGAGNDALTGGAGDDSITGNAGVDALDGAAGADSINGGDGVDAITGGTGSDLLTGGAGADTFIFGTTGSVSGTDLDSITDFGKASDILSFTAVTVLAAETNGTTATSDVDTTTGGKISFAPADDTFAEMVTAILADSELDVAGSTAFFEFGSDTYVYNAGSATGGADDQIIKLTGVTGLVTITDLGTTLTIA